MAVPKKKISKSKRNSRRAHDGINKISISFDSVTGEPKLPHHISLKDGYYNGKQLIKPKTKEDNKESENTKEEDTKKIKVVNDTSKEIDKKVTKATKKEVTPNVTDKKVTKTTKKEKISKDQDKK
ncbi:50S ribosomal protein L32 [Candidatus Aquarickettsia rohweri]|uniref:Large ribosomal subunit protein bL32 n=1 Tax=Candidatus Aquarickettsia rohweri TaxID=2602574 RepID=A0A3R9XQ94_9RICK|nr:50S ribosomal protein L32 [Candidatus Aquarickettsia rohweri]